MNFDFKITTWERVRVPEEYEQEILKAIEDGKIDSAEDILDYLETKNNYDFSYSKLDNADEQMTVEENGGNTTIEVMENGEVIYQNG